MFGDDLGIAVVGARDRTTGQRQQADKGLPGGHYEKNKKSKRHLIWREDKRKKGKLGYKVVHGEYSPVNFLIGVNIEREGPTDAPLGSASQWTLRLLCYRPDFPFLAQPLLLCTALLCLTLLGIYTAIVIAPATPVQLNCCYAPCRRDGLGRGDSARRG
jgi:hypothetical protein